MVIKMFIDTHVHLNSKELGMHLDEVISDAFANNVKKMIVVGYDLETSKKAIELAHQFDLCYACLLYTSDPDSKFPR